MRLTKSMSLVAMALFGTVAASAQNFDDYFEDKTLRLDYIVAALAHHIAVETEVGGNDGGLGQCLEKAHDEQHVLGDGIPLETHPAVKERLSLDDARHAAPSERKLVSEVEERALEERAVVVDMLKACRVVVAVDGVHAHRHHVGATAVGEIGIA